MRAFVALAFGLAMMAAPAAAADGNGIRRVAASSRAPFSAMTEVNGVLYLSGQIGRGPDGTMSLDWKV